MSLVNKFALPLALILAGMYMLQKAVYDVRKVFSSRNWPSISGVVVKHHDDSAMGSARTHRAFYTYTLEGHTYEGNVYFISGRMTSGSELDDFFNRYAVGKPVTVFYNPRKLKESLLERDQDTNWFFLGFSLIVLAAGIWFLIMSLLH
jgi:hypothetical protein